MCVCVCVCVSLFQPYSVIYGGQFPQLEELIVPWREPATLRYQLTATCIPLMRFEPKPQRRGASSFKARRPSPLSHGRPIKYAHVRLFIYVYIHLRIYSFTYLFIVF